MERVIPTQPDEGDHLDNGEQGSEVGVHACGDGDELVAGRSGQSDASLAGESSRQSPLLTTHIPNPTVPFLVCHLDTVSLHVVNISSAAANLETVVHTAGQSVGLRHDG